MFKPSRKLLLTVLLGWWCAPAGPVLAQGEQRCDSGRTGFAATPLRPPYRTVWVHEGRQRPRPAWKEPIWEPQRIDFDYAFPVASGEGLALIASSADHAVQALDLADGQPRWKFFTEGPVRLAPTVAGGRVYFGSDDGKVYCLDAASGRLQWQFRPSIPDQRLLGNEQMISRWPVRTGVLVQDGLAYTTFGMLSPEGICIVCLDAESGAPRWINDTSGTRYMARPHVPGMGGVSPQGYLALSGDVLIVPCGRAPPALFDRHSGKLLYHEAEGDFTGGAWTMAYEGLVLTPCESLAKEYGTDLYRPAGDQPPVAFASASLVALEPHTGREVFTLQGGRRAVAADDGQLTLVGDGRLTNVQWDDVRHATARETTIRHTTGHFVDASSLAHWQVESGPVYRLVQADNTLIAGGENRLMCLDAADGELLWQTNLDGQVRDLCITADGLLASTTSGRVVCFQPAASGPAAGDAAGDIAGRRSAVRSTDSVAPARPEDDVAAPGVNAAAVTAEHVLRVSGARAGNCLILGQATEELALQLVRQSDLMVYLTGGTGPRDPRRQRWDRQGLYGSRIALHNVDPRNLPYAPYFADLVVVILPDAPSLMALDGGQVYRVVRPCGGTAVLRFPDRLLGDIQRWLDAAEVPDSERQPMEGGMQITRGSLAGAGQWTHQYADPGRSCASDDQRVRLPLEALWFGSLGPAKIVSRHFRTPAPLVIDGRCFVPGTDDLIAMDIYTGRIFWERHLPGLAHWPSAYRGSCLAADAEAVYAPQGRSCLRLDPASGKTLGVLQAPEGDGPAALSADQGPLIWEYLAVTEQRVVGSLGDPHVKRAWWSRAYPENGLLFALDKQTHEVVWTYRPAQPVDTNAIAITAGRVLLIEGRPRYQELRRGVTDSGQLPPRRLIALDLDNGQPIWETSEVAATLNSLWCGGGVAVATINPFSRSMEDPVVAGSPDGAAVYAVEDGRRLWTVDSLTTCSPAIVGQTLYLPEAYDLWTGQPLTSENPLTDRPEHFTPGFPKTCATYSASPNLLMARSGSLGFFDLRQRSGTYHYPIVRASCWINMIPAGGLVVVPEGSSSCVCGYNYKTSLALIAAEREHHYGIARPRAGGPVTQLRINFGAPGDRPDAEGNVWFAYPRPVAYGRPLAKARYGPKVGGGVLPVEEVASTGRYEVIARHADWSSEDGERERWLTSCGVQGDLDLRLQLAGSPEEPLPYRVTLTFRTTDALRGPRAGEVRLQDATVLRGLELDGPASAPGRSVTRTFEVTSEGEIHLRWAATGAGGSPPTLCGLAVLQQSPVPDAGSPGGVHGP